MNLHTSSSLASLGSGPKDGLAEAYDVDAMREQAMHYAQQAQLIRRFLGWTSWGMEWAGQKKAVAACVVDQVDRFERNLDGLPSSSEQQSR